MKKVIWLFALCSINFFSFAQTEVESPAVEPIDEGIPGLEIPKTSETDMVLEHTGYTLCYDTYLRQAKWVAYELTADETKSVVNRSDNFKPDPLLRSASASNSDYVKSGYDKGHLAPAADMCYSEETMTESFYLTNISPQEPGLNRGMWKKLEELIRQWAVEDNAVYIVTGGVLTKDLPTIGADKVAVPQFFYKVVLDYTKPEVKGIGFIMANKPLNEPLQHYAVTIDSVEKVTNINFFYKLPPKEEKVIESTLDLSKWHF